MFVQKDPWNRGAMWRVKSNYGNLFQIAYLEKRPNGRILRQLKKRLKRKGKQLLADPKTAHRIPYKGVQWR